MPWEIRVTLCNGDQCKRIRKRYSSVVLVIRYVWGPVTTIFGTSGLVLDHKLRNDPQMHINLLCLGVRVSSWRGTDLFSLVHGCFISKMYGCLLGFFVALTLGFCGYVGKNR